MSDIAIRAIKTFIQAFFGVFIPACVAYLGGGWPTSWGDMWLVLAPAVSAALAAGISACWNYIKEVMESDDD